MKKLKTYRVYFNTWVGYEIEARNQDEAYERVLNGEFNEKTETKGELEFDAVERICSICKQPEDDDGRCGCTNKDSK